MLPLAEHTWMCRECGRILAGMAALAAHALAEHPERAVVWVLDLDCPHSLPHDPCSG